MLIDKLNGNQEQLKALSSLMYSFTKDAARESFSEYLEDEGVTDESWKSFKLFLKENGIDTYL